MQEDIGKVGMMIAVVVALGFVAVVAAYMLSGLHDASHVDNVETFVVTDTSVDRVCVLDYNPVSSTMIVQYYNDTAWKTLSTSDYTQVGETVTVKASAMD